MPQNEHRVDRDHVVATGLSHLAVLRAAVAEAASRARADAIGLVDLAREPWRNLDVDEVAVAYGGGPDAGGGACPRVRCRLVGARPVPAREPPAVAAKLSAGALTELAAACAQVPADALPVVTTTWSLSRLSLADRLRFLDTLIDASARRTLAWVSVEGVGVAPGVPTLGDRRASGHSIVGVTLLDRETVRAEAVGRCWSRGRVLEWLAGA